MKKSIAIVLALLFVCSLSLFSCAEKATTPVTVKILVGSSEDGELKNFVTEETLFDQKIDVEGESITVNDILNHLNNNVEGITCNYATGDSGEAEFAGINDYTEKDEKTDEYLYDMAAWRFMVNNKSLALTDVVEKDATITMYYITWVYDATPD